MGVEFVDALQAAEAACDELRTMLEKERKLVQWLTHERDDARNIAECANSRADVAEVECAKLKRMLEEEKKLPRLEKDDEVRVAQRQIEQLDQELAHARKEAELARKDTASIGSECAKLKRMLEEEQKLVQRLRLEKDEVQLAKRQIGELDQELSLARKDADAAENEWTQVKRDLKNMEEHAEFLKLQCQEIRESASRQDDERRLELANALNASVIAKTECATLKRMLIEEGKTVQRLIIEKDDEAELARRQIEKMDQELAYARREAQYARNDADIAENGSTKVTQFLELKRELKEKEELVKNLELEIEGTRQQVEEIIQELNDARTEIEHARNFADTCLNAWERVKKDQQEKLKLIEELKLECLEPSERAQRHVEEKELELADALNPVTAATSGSAVAQDCTICVANAKDMTFGCGHMTCGECGMALSTCPICRKEITCRIKLFP